MLVAGLVIDGGLGLAAEVRATDEAQSAARAGAQAIDLAAYRQAGPSPWTDGGHPGGG